jgi:hypothetical protein
LFNLKLFMAYDINWLVPQRVLHIRFFGDVSVREAQQSYEAARLSLDGRPELVHILVDHVDVGKFPTSWRDYGYLNPGDITLNGGWVVVAGINAKQRFTLKLVATVMGLQVNTVGSVDEALMFLREYDPAVA